jgi:hypothetical protein
MLFYFEFLLCTHIRKIEQGPDGDCHAAHVGYTRKINAQKPLIIKIGGMRRVERPSYR